MNLIGSWNTIFPCWSGGARSSPTGWESHARGGGRAAGVCPQWVSESVSHARAGGPGGALFAKKWKMSTFCSKIDFWMKKWLLDTFSEKSDFLLPKCTFSDLGSQKASNSTRIIKVCGKGAEVEWFFENFHFLSLFTEKVTFGSQKWLLDQKVTFYQKSAPRASPVLISLCRLSFLDTFWGPFSVKSCFGLKSWLFGPKVTFCEKNDFWTKKSTFYKKVNFCDSGLQK